MFRGCTQHSRLKNIFLLSFIILLVVFNPFTVKSDSNNSSFSVEINGPIDSQNVKAGGPVHFIINIRNYTPDKEIMNKQDVIFDYDIKNSNDEIITKKTDTKAVLVGNNTSTPYKETFYLPDNIGQGFYTLNVKITSIDGKYSNETEVSFKVVRVGDFGRDLILIFLGIGFTIACIGFYYEYRKVSKMKVSDRDLEKYIGKKKK